MCECRQELINKEKCNKGFIWNPSNCRCECDKSCYIKAYLDHKNCKCRRLVVDLLVEECSKNIDENGMVYNETFNILLNDYKCNSCALYILLFVVTLVISVIIGSVFIYFYWYSKRNITNFYY